MYLFVYYKLDPQKYPELKSQILDMQDTLTSQYPGITCQLLKRPEVDDKGRETWMETYHLADINENEFCKNLERITHDERFPQPRRNEFFISHS